MSAKTEKKLNDLQSWFLRLIIKKKKEKKWPGLVTEVDKIIENANSALRLDARKYRKIVTEACHKLNEERIRKATENSVKCKRIKDEKYGGQVYFDKKDINYSREIFRARYGLKEFVGNYSHNKKYKEKN